MTGGLTPVGSRRARLATLLGSLFWLLAALSGLEWSVAPSHQSAFPDLRPEHAASDWVAPAEPRPDPAVYAQLPAAPALADSRLTVPIGSAKGGPDQSPVTLPRLPSLTAVAAAPRHPPTSSEARAEPMRSVGAARAPPPIG